MPNPPLRIGHTLHGLGLGGAQKVVASIVRGRDRSAFEHFVYSPGDGVLREEIEAAGAKVTIVKRRLPKIDPFWISALARVFEADRIDLVHGHLFGDSLHGVLAARRRALPALVTLHNVFHGFPRFQRIGYRWLLARRPRAVACSTAVYDAFVDAGLGAGLEIIANGIEGPRGDTLAAGERQRVRERFGAGPDTVLFATVGRLVVQKGHRELLQAFAEIVAERGESVALVIFGDGPMRAELEERCRELALEDRVSFAGFESEVARLLPAVDAVVFSSHHEGLPVALLEAMAAGRPILATDLPSLRDALGDGLIVPPRDVARLAEALGRLADDRALRAGLGDEARQRFLESFSAERMVREYEAIYRELCDR